MYISKVRLQQCFILKNVCEAVNNPLSVEGGTCIEVEGLFIVNPRLYKKHKEFILSKLLKPATGFECIIDNCMEQFGQNKTVIGIHIRRGDFVLNPLEGSFVLPIPVKYILSWLAANISYIENPAIFVCSDDKNVYKEIEKAGFEVFTTARLFAEGAEPFNYEQLEWEILRRCDILLNSNSTFSFSAAMLSNTIPVCYQFSVKEKKFIPFDPWMSEPLQFYTSAPYLWSYLYTRFTLVANMVSKKSALRRLGKDINRWLFWKSTKVTRLYYLYGLSNLQLIEMV